MQVFFVLLASFAVKIKESVKKYNYIVLTDFQHTKQYHSQNLSPGFILEIFLNFRQLQPR